MLDRVRIGDTLQVADLVIGVAGVAQVRVGDGLEPVQGVVALGDVDAVDIVDHICFRLPFG